MGMVVKISSITKEIVGLISRPEVVGLATHRHLPHERAIYLKHGRCGFAIDILANEDGEKKLYSVLVEVSAKPTKRRIKSFMKLGGTVVYQLSERAEDGFRIKKRRKANYRNGEHLFKQVEIVRAAFYKKYKELKAMEKVKPKKNEEEIFHAVGITDDLPLGV